MSVSPQAMLPRPDLALRTPLKKGLSLLLQAYQYAEELQRQLEDFALELAVLREVGVTTSDLRWLLCRGFVEHYVEATLPQDTQRVLHKTDHLGMSSQSCFVLTAAGLSLAVKECNGDRGPVNGSPPTARLGLATKPHWDADLRELWFAGELLKRQKRPAPNQEIVLAAFEEEEWGPRIDDPIPGQAESDPVQCLHDTIKRLNMSLLRPLLRFRCDGTGRGIRWEVTP